MVVGIICSTEFGSSLAGHLKLLQPARRSVRAAFSFLNATHAWRKACRECQSKSPRTAVFKWTLPTCVTYPTAQPMYTAPCVLTFPRTALFLWTLPLTCTYTTARPDTHTHLRVGREMLQVVGVNVLLGIDGCQDLEGDASARFGHFHCRCQEGPA